MSTSGSESHLEHRCLDSQSGDWLDWLEPEPAWVAECRAALEPVLGVGTVAIEANEVQFPGDWSARLYNGRFRVSHPLSPLETEFQGWHHAAQFICAAQEQAAGEVADWLEHRCLPVGRSEAIESLRSGAWRGE